MRGVKKNWAAMALVALLAACAPAEREAETAAVPAGCITDPPEQIGGPISLVDKTGAPVTQAQFAGKPTLVYFGFAFCPDICPMSLQTARAAFEALGPEGETVQSALITLDPERDTPEVIGRYAATEVFPTGLVGLTGTPEQTAAAAKAFRVGWRKSQIAGSAADYVIDHTSFFYLMSSEWRPLAMYPSSLSPSDAAQCMRLGLAKPS